MPRFSRHSHCISNVYEKMFIKEQSSKNGTQFFESVQYKGNIRRYLKEAPAIVTKMIAFTNDKAHHPLD